MPHKDPAVRRAYMREWKLKNQAQHRWLNKLADAAMNANRRAAKYGCEGSLTVADIREIFAVETCFYCGGKPEVPTVDHVIPLHNGGPNIRDNIVMACRRCNISKFRSDRPDKWSWHHGSCVECGSTSRKHICHGLCSRCYGRNRRAAS